MNIIEQLVPPVFVNGFRRLRKGKTTYRIGNHNINIPPKFRLPHYQKKFRLYDRFLPVLAKNLPPNKTIIDVGANIGDTLFALLPQCNNPIICIEPSDLFFPYLENNIGLLAQGDFGRVKAFKRLVGTGSLTGELVHSISGTAKIKIANVSGSQTHIALDLLVERKSDVVLLKVDTDGFDFDVIRSADKICTESKPILFWENEISDDFQNMGFNELYPWLTEKGYTYICLFDNFGNLITEGCDFGTLKNINSYIYSVQKKGNARTLHYTDVLATTEKYRSAAENAIQEYKRDWING